MSGVAAVTQSFSGRLLDFLEMIEYRRAVTAAEKDEIYRLRYDSYLREGAITPNDSKRLTDRYDDTDNVWLYGVHIGGELAASIRIHVVSRQHPDSPAAEAFGDVVGPAVAEGKTLVDPNRFVTDHVIARLYPMLPHVTVRIACLAAEHFHADLTLASVRTEHQAFYKRLFRFYPLCPARPYPTLVKPLSLMACEHRLVRDEILRRYPCFGSSYTERAMLFDRESGWEADDGVSAPRERMVAAASG